MQYRGNLLFRSCMEWMERRQKRGQSIHPFCNKVKRDPLETECTDDRSSVALCNLVQHVNELPPHFQVGLAYNLSTSRHFQWCPF